MAGKQVANALQRRLAHLLEEAAKVAKAELSRIKGLTRRFVILLDAVKVAREFGT